MENEKKKGFIVKADKSRSGGQYKMKGVTLNILETKISSDDTDGRLAVFEQTALTQNGGPPMHLHPYQDELFYVLEGKFVFQVGSERFDAETGDTVFLPKQIAHGFIQLSEKGKMIVAYNPAGKMEQFFKKTSLWLNPPSKEEITKAFEESDMKIVGPPLQL